MATLPKLRPSRRTPSSGMVDMVAADADLFNSAAVLEAAPLSGGLFVSDIKSSTHGFLEVGLGAGLSENLHFTVLAEGRCPNTSHRARNRRGPSVRVDWLDKDELVRLVTGLGVDGVIAGDVVELVVDRMIHDHHPRLLRGFRESARNVVIQSHEVALSRPAKTKRGPKAKPKVSPSNTSD